MEDNEMKGIILVVFFLDTIIFGCVPYFIVGKPGRSVGSGGTREVVLSYLNCFSGGVFLGACLLHLLVEGRETLNEYWELTGQDVEFPVYETITACGFFLIALVEQLAHMCLHKAQAGNNNIVKVTPSTEVSVIAANGSPGNGVVGNGHHHSGHDHDSHDHTDHIMSVMDARPMRAFLLLGAFSFHTVFDGLAVGLQAETDELWQMFAGILIHKSLVALCLGLQLFTVYSKTPIRAAVCILLFSCISPIGVGVGMAVISMDVNLMAKTLSRGVLEGLSTGTFLYVAFFEILHEELGVKRGLLRLLVVVLGFTGTLLPKLLSHGHGEEEHHDDDDH